MSFRRFISRRHKGRSAIRKQRHSMIAPSLDIFITHCESSMRFAYCSQANLIVCR